jgi:hypothetical protein
MRGVGPLALSVCLVACNDVTLSATTVSVAITLSVSREDQARLDARLTPQRAQLRPGEEVTLQLEIRSKERGALALQLLPEVTGPSTQIAVQAPAIVTATRGITNVPVRVRATQSIVPGRYELRIALHASSGPPDDDDKTKSP